MNIFILDMDLRKNAQAYCDKHLVKIILEIAQLMCTVVNEMGGISPYKTTHKNHPCTRWLMENGANWELLLSLAEELNKEYKYRFNHTNNHKSFDVIKSLIKPKYSNNVFSGMFNSVTDEVRRTNVVDTIKYYRKYYISKSKEIDMKWTKRETPLWFYEV